VTATSFRPGLQPVTSAPSPCPSSCATRGEPSDFSLPVTVEEIARVGENIVGTVRNRLDEIVTGPVGVSVICFDDAGVPIAAVDGYTEQDNVRPGATASPTARVPCPGSQSMVVRRAPRPDLVNGDPVDGAGGRSRYWAYFAARAASTATASSSRSRWTTADSHRAQASHSRARVLGADL